MSKDKTIDYIESVVDGLKIKVPVTTIDRKTSSSISDYNNGKDCTDDVSYLIEGDEDFEWLLSLAYNLPNDINDIKAKFAERFTEEESLDDTFLDLTDDDDDYF